MLADEGLLQDALAEAPSIGRSAQDFRRTGSARRRDTSVAAFTLTQVLRGPRARCAARADAGALHAAPKTRRRGEER